MHTLFRYCPCVLAVALAPSGALPAEPAPTADQGRVLLLGNGRALEGDIRAERGGYCVKHAAGEVWLPADKVVSLCATWEEACAFMRSHANLQDPDERLRLARWCQAYGLRAEALAEASAALKMRPAHAASKQLVEILQREPASAAKTPLAPAPHAQSVPAKMAMAIDVSAEALGMFASRVQPVLMNTCASCHAGSKTETFKLVRASGNNQATRRATQQNMAICITQIDPAHPNASPLLLHAVTDHGKAGQVPLKAQSPPYRVLQDWIQLTLATNPFLREQATASAAVSASPRAAEEQTSRWLGPPERPMANPDGRSAPVVSRSKSATGEVSPETPRANPPTAILPADDFDPLPYNRQFHPTRRDNEGPPVP